MDFFRLRLFNGVGGPISDKKLTLTSIPIILSSGLLHKILPTTTTKKITVYSGAHIFTTNYAIRIRKRLQRTPYETQIEYDSYKKM